MKKAMTAITILLAVLMLGACSSEADVASQNLSQAAEQFEIERRVVFLNGITDSYPLVVVGRCSIYADETDRQIEVTCKTGTDPDTFKKHYLGLSDNMSYFVEQLEPVPVDVYRYRVFFRPEQILPDVDVETSES